MVLRRNFGQPLGIIGGFFVIIIGLVLLVISLFCASEAFSDPDSDNSIL